LPHDPLYRYVLMMQFALPPAMNIGSPWIPCSFILISEVSSVHASRKILITWSCVLCVCDLFDPGTMAQLFDVGQEECSVIFLWTYLIAAIALTTWSTIFMSILSWGWGWQEEPTLWQYWFSWNDSAHG
jgi:hypothetical protein